MTSLSSVSLAGAGLDAAALKPAEMDLRRATALPVETLIIDYEGREYVPDAETLRALVADKTVRMAVPVRADGFDPLGDDARLDAIPEAVEWVVVAGHPAYLDSDERRRAVAPRLRAAAERADDPWVGTEGVERVALAVGGTQYDLLSASTRRDVRALRAAGFDGEIAVYAPLVLSDGDDDTILDAVGDYAARRPAVGNALPDDTPTDSTATGHARETLLAGCREFGLVGDVDSVRERVDALYECGVDHIVGYPARGLDPFLE